MIPSWLIKAQNCVEWFIKIAKKNTNFIFPLIIWAAHDPNYLFNAKQALHKVIIQYLDENVKCNIPPI